MLMCKNAMTYNTPDTIYHQAAKKYLALGLKIIIKVRGLLVCVWTGCEMILVSILTNRNWNCDQTFTDVMVLSQRWSLLPPPSSP